MMLKQPTDQQWHHKAQHDMPMIRLSSPHIWDNLSTIGLSAMVNLCAKCKLPVFVYFKNIEDPKFKKTGSCYPDNAPLVWL